MLQQLKCALTAMLILALAFLAFNANAEDSSFTGNFSIDYEVKTFNFTITEALFSTFRTWSYTDGVNAAWQSIPRRGFAPSLALFDAATGKLVNTNDGAGPAWSRAGAYRQRLGPTSMLSLWRASTSSPSSNTTILRSAAILPMVFRYDGAGYADFRNGFYDVSGDQGDSH